MHDLFCFFVERRVERFVALFLMEERRLIERRLVELRFVLPVLLLLVLLFPVLLLLTTIFILYIDIKKNERK
jgi:hypothetical protein